MLAYGYGQLAYASSCLILGFLCSMMKEAHKFDITNYLPSKTQLENGTKCWIFPEHKQALKEMTKLGTLQWLLSGCEKILIIFFNRLTIEERSEYSFVINVASLVIRVIYFPLEDSAYTYFAKLEPDSIKTGKMEVIGDIRVMCNVTSLLSSIGFLLVIYSYNYSYALLKTLYSSTWSNPVFYFLLL